MSDKFEFDENKEESKDGYDLPGPDAQTYTEPAWGLADAVRAVLLLLLIISLVGLLMYFVLDRDVSGKSSILEAASLTVLLLLQSSAMMYVSWYYGVKKYGGRFEDLGLREFQIGRGIYYSFLFLIPLYIFEFTYVYLIQTYLGAELPETDYIAMLGGGNLGLALAAFLIVIVAPVAEETFFRGFLYPALKKRFGIVLGVIFASLVFGLFHLDGWLVLPVGLIGAINIYLYERTKSLDSCIILHSINNMIALLLLLSHGG